MSEKKNTLDKIKNIIEMTDKKISELEDMVIELSKISSWKEIEEEQIINELWDNFKWPNIHVIDIPKEEQKEEWTGKNIFKNNGWQVLKFKQRSKNFTEP